jgi:hypothetical protein
MMSVAPTQAEASLEFMLRECMDVLMIFVVPVDAYRVAKSSGMLSAMNAGRCLQELEARGLAARVEDGGGNPLASTFVHA